MTITVIYRGVEDTTIDTLLIKGNGQLNFFKDEDWERVKFRYRGYFEKRIQTDKNPSGMFIVSSSSNYSQAQFKEAGKDLLDINAKIDEVVINTVKEEAPHLVEEVKKQRKRK